MRHEPMDRHCAYWNGARVSFLTRLALGIRCRICSNVGAALGATVNPPMRPTVQNHADGSGSGLD